METVTAIKTASRGIWYELRCLWCETLIGWAMKLEPEGYVCSCVEAVVNARVDAVDAKDDALRLHREKMAYFETNLSMRLVLEKIAGRREYDKADYDGVLTYKIDEGMWTVDEYLADAVLDAAPGQCASPEKER
jgi:hypothetical protein